MSNAPVTLHAGEVGLIPDVTAIYFRAVIAQRIEQGASIAKVESSSLSDGASLGN